MTKQFIHIILLCLIMGVFGACSKSGGGSSGGGNSGGSGGGAVTTEEKLVAKFSAAAIETSPSSNFNFTIDIQSKMPAAGVTIKVDVKREDNNAAVYNVTANSTFASNNFTINGLPPGQVYCLATITVTSVSTPANVSTGSFRVLWK
jgi:hypothetical protein